MCYPVDARPVLPEAGSQVKDFHGILARATAGDSFPLTPNTPHNDAGTRAIRPAASPGGAAGSARVPPPARARFAVLDPARARVLAAWCEQIHPEHASRPLTAQADAAEHIDTVCSSSPLLQCALIVAVDGLDERARDLHGRLFADCAPDQRDSALETFAATDPDAFGLVNDLAYEAYYSVSAVLADVERVTRWRDGC